MSNVLLALYSRLIFLVFSLTQPRHHYHHHTKKNIVKKITNVAYIINEWWCGVCVVSSIVININCSNIKYCGIIHLLMQPKKDIKSACKLLLPPSRRPLNSINLVLHSVNNAYQRLQLLKFTFTLESRAKPRLAPNSQRTTANYTFQPAQVFINLTLIIAHRKLAEL